MKVFVCARSEWESLPCRDFTFKCLDGDVKAHHIIMVFQSKTIANVTPNAEIDMDFSVDDVAHALNYIYGLAVPDNMRYEIGTDSLPLVLYNIFSYLQVSSKLLDCKLYMKSIGIDRYLFEHNHESVRFNWLLTADKLPYHPGIIDGLKRLVCMKLVYGKFMKKDNIDRLMMLDINSLKHILEFYSTVPGDCKWVIEFLIAYMTPENTNDVKNILLPRTSISVILPTHPYLANAFELQPDSFSLLIYQLERGVLYDRYYIYNLYEYTLSGSAISEKYPLDRKIHLNSYLAELYKNVRHNGCAH